MTARNQAETDQDELESNQENKKTRESEHLGNESENRRGKRGPAAVVGADAAFAAASVPAAAAPHAAVPEVAAGPCGKDQSPRRLGSHGGHCLHA